MLLSKPTDIVTGTILTPQVIKDYLFPLRIATVHGIIDHANFDKIGATQYRNYIETISDMPGSGKLFSGKWLDFCGDYDQHGGNLTDKEYGITARYKQYYVSGTFAQPLFDNLMFGTLFQSIIPSNYIAYWGIVQSGANNNFKIYSYDTATQAFTEIASTGNYAAAGTRTLFSLVLDVVGDVDANAIVGASIPVSLDNYIVLTPHTYGYGGKVYLKFSDMANYANQKSHYIRSMEFQHSMTLEGQQMMMQGVKPTDSTYGYAGKWFGHDILDPPPKDPGPNASKEERDRYKRESLAFGAAATGTPYFGDKFVSINNKFSLEKPYASKLVSFDTRGSCKMKRVDDSGNLLPNNQAVIYQVYVSNESQEELEITLHCMFSGEYLLGAEDYIFIMGRIEFLFESRL